MGIPDRQREALERVRAKLGGRRCFSDLEQLMKLLEEELDTENADEAMYTRIRLAREAGLCNLYWLEERVGCYRPEAGKVVRKVIEQEIGFSPEVATATIGYLNILAGFDSPQARKREIAIFLRQLQELEHKRLHTAAKKQAEEEKPAPVVESKSGRALKPGEIVTFGRFRQKATVQELTPIEWLVLMSNEHKAMLLSRYVLQWRWWSNENKSSWSWENSEVRHWLNETFLPSAFSESERKRIIPVGNIYPDMKSGHMVKSNDAVFLMEQRDLEYYRDKLTNDSPLMSIREQILNAPPSPYVSSTIPFLDAGKSVSWWLAAPNASGLKGMYQDKNGACKEAPLQLPTMKGIRPMIFITNRQ